MAVVLLGCMLHIDSVEVSKASIDHNYFHFVPSWVTLVTAVVVLGCMLHIEVSIGVNFPDVRTGRLDKENAILVGIAVVKAWLFVLNFVDEGILLDTISGVLTDEILNATVANMSVEEVWVTAAGSDSAAVNEESPIKDDVSCFSYCVCCLRNQFTC